MIGNTLYTMNSLVGFMPEDGAMLQGTRLIIKEVTLCSELNSIVLDIPKSLKFECL